MSPRQAPASTCPAWASEAAHRRPAGRSRLFLATRAVARGLVALVLGALLPAYLVLACWLVEVTR